MRMKQPLSCLEELPKQVSEWVKKALTTGGHISHNIDMSRAREIVAASGTPEGTDKRSPGSSRLARRIDRGDWIGIAGQVTLFVVLGVVIANSTITGRHLLAVAAVWFLAVLAWMKVGPSDFFISLGKHNRAKIAVAYAIGWLLQVFMLGWLMPLGIGLYRVTVR